MPSMLAWHKRLSKVSLGLTDELLEQGGLEVTKFCCLPIAFLQLGYLLQVFVFKNLRLIQRKKNQPKIVCPK